MHLFGGGVDFVFGGCGLEVGTCISNYDTSDIMMIASITVLILRPYVISTVLLVFKQLVVSYWNVS